LSCLGEARNRADREERAERNVQVKPLLQSGEDPCGFERIATDMGKRFSDTNRGNFQDFLPDLTDHTLAHVISRYSWIATSAVVPRPIPPSPNVDVLQAIDSQPITLI